VLRGGSRHASCKQRSRGNADGGFLRNPGYEFLRKPGYEWNQWCRLRVGGERG